MNIGQRKQNEKKNYNQGDNKIKMKTVSTKSKSRRLKNTENEIP